MRISLLCLGIFTITFGCTNRGRTDTESVVDAEALRLLQSAMNAHGAEVLGDAVYQFEFRGDVYRAYRNSGVFEYERQYVDSLGPVRDVVNNEGIYREVEGRRVPIDEETRASIYRKVNSGVYFSSLPFPLRDPAVIPRYLGLEQIGDKRYEALEITFREEDGGPDFQDRFIYWINSTTGRIDYFAYYFYTEETGSRFRRLTNVRNVGGFLVSDHENYSAVEDTFGTRIEAYVEVLRQRGVGALADTSKYRLVSEVKLENVSLTPVK